MTLHLNDNIFDCPQFIEAGDEAVRFFVRALFFVAAKRRSGVIREEDYGSISSDKNPREHVARLVVAGLIHPSEDGTYVLRKRGRYWRITGEPDDGWDAARAKVAPIVFARDGGLCTYCGSTDDPTIDHIVPRVQGGAHELSNLTTACRPCNGAKNDRTPEEWVNRPARCVAYAASKTTMEFPAC